MKKSSLFASALLLAGFSFTAQAQSEVPEVYIAGAFNNYAPEGAAEWALSPLEDNEDIFRGEFDIPAGEFSFNVVFQTTTLVPGEFDADTNDVVPAESNVSVLVDDPEFYSGTFTFTGMSNTSWVNENWAGGKVQVTLDFTSYDIIITPVTATEPEIPYNVFISGAFNGYDPAGLEIWQLSALDEPGSFRGVFDIPAGEFSFNLVYETFALVPGMMVDDDYVPAEGGVEVLVSDPTSFEGFIANTGLSQDYWYNTNWAGGAVEVTVDFNNHTVVIAPYSSDEPSVGTNSVFIAGEFNDYAPEGLETWALSPLDEEGAYRGTFYVPAGKFAFNLQYESFSLVPAAVVDGEKAAAEENVEVLVEDPVSYEGDLVSTGFSKVSWVNRDWAGGDVEVTVDLANETVVIAPVNDLPIEPAQYDMFLSGNFNDFTTEGTETWALGLVEGTEDVYRGTFTIAEGPLSFHVQYMNLALVPAVEEDGELVAAEENVDVLVGDDSFQGSFTTTGLANYNWVNSAWAGGDLEVTVDFGNGLIILSAVNGQGGEPAQYEMFLSGNFNDFTTEGTETWSLGLVEGTEDVYRGTFTIAEGPLSFHVQYMNLALVPAVEEDGELVAAEENVDVLVGDDSFQGSFTTTGLAKYNWINSDWAGGDLEVTVDFGNSLIILSAVNGQGEQPAPEMFISGNFNDYAPEGLEIWGLTATEDENTFRGTFSVPEGMVSFHIDYQTMALVPAVDVDGELEAATENVVILADDPDFYNGKFAHTGLANVNWVINNWNGGDLEVTVDFFNNEINVSTVGAGEEPAPELFIAGSFNEYDPAGLEIWGLTRTDAEDVFRGTFELPEGTNSFYFNYQGINLVPGEFNAEDEDVVASEENVVVLDGDDFFSGSFASIGMAKSQWVIENWAGGSLEATVDFGNQEVVFSVAKDEPVEPNYELFIAGNFNDYAPEGLDIWALTATDDENTFRGTFEIPAGELSFHIDYQQMSLVPGAYNEEDEDIIATTDNVVVLDGDDFFSGSFASTSVAQYNWVNTAWEGGLLEVTVDFASQEIILSVVNEGPAEPTEELFIAGNFNDYAPEGLDIWALTATDAEGVYRGTFELPEGEISFHINYQTTALVPAVEGEDGDIVAATEDVEVLVEDPEFYSGLFTSTGLANVNWVCQNFAGGNLEVTLDFNSGEILLSIGEPSEPVADVWYIRGAFNDYDPAGLEIWALNPVEGEENGVYTGTFSIAEGLFAVNFLAPSGDVFIPAAIADEEIEFIDDEFVGQMDMAYDDTEAAYVWKYEDWTGGYVTFTIDANTGELTIELSDKDGVKLVDADAEEMIFNLQGVRVSRNNLEKGIYIVNGKKMVVR